MDNAHDRLNENSSLTSNNINTEQKENRNGVALNGHSIKRRTSYRPGDKVPLSCLDLKVVYVRVSRYDIDDTIPEYLRLNCIPLNHDTLLQVNGVGSSVSTDGISTLLRRDRFDKKTEEVTFVNTDSIRMTRSVKFEVFHNGIPMISGVIDLSYSNRSLEELKNQEPRWGMNCESKVGTGLFTVKRSTRHESPEIEVYIAGCFSGNPIIVTKTLQLSSRKNLSRKAMLKSIPEYEAADSSEQDVASTLSLQVCTLLNKCLRFLIYCGFDCFQVYAGL